MRLRLFPELAVFIVLLCLPAHSEAACTDPPGTGGDIIFNSDYKWLQYCNDTQWIGFPRGALGCALPWGGTLAHGNAVTAFQAENVGFGSTCVSETRECDEGDLSGSFEYQSCTVDGAADCVLDGQTVLHGSSFTFYSAEQHLDCAGIGQSRVCDNGNLDGSNTYMYASCDPIPVLGDISISPAVSGKTWWTFSVDGPLNLGSYGDWTIVPATDIEVLTKMWGAGGGMNGAGSGGYTTGHILLTAGTPYILRVGQRGRVDGARTHGGGGRSGGDESGSGGGLSGIFTNSATQANAQIIAGGGGGAGESANGGSGGGASGVDGQSDGGVRGRKGTQAAGGAGANAGTALQGGDGPNGDDDGYDPYAVDGGGGGGGYFGGGGASEEDGGGGGSGYIGGATGGTGSTVAGTSSSSPGNASDADRAGAGRYDTDGRLILLLP